MLLRLMKQVQADNGEIIATQYHRATLAPHEVPSRVLQDTNAHLNALGFPNIAAADVQVLNSVVQALAAWRQTKIVPEG